MLKRWRRPKQVTLQIEGSETVTVDVGDWVYVTFSMSVRPTEDETGAVHGSISMTKRITVAGVR